MAGKRGTVWTSEERRRAERRIRERRQFGRELTHAERAGQQARKSERRQYLDRRQADIDEAHDRLGAH